MKIQTKDGKNLGDTIPLGIVEAGKSKEFEFIIFNNESLAQVSDIKIEIAHKEVEILDYPKELKPNNSGILRILWSPNLTVKQGLKTTIKLTAKELYM